MVGYEIVRSGRLPLAGERFMLEGLLPVRLGEVHVSIPSGSLRWFVNHPDRVEVVSQSPNAASFRSVNRPAIAQEDGAPPFQTVAAAVFVNYDPKGSAAVQSWEDAGRAIHPLLSGAEKPAPEIATEVENLSAGQADLLAKLNAAYTFVSRQIRYVAVEIGIGGFQPHPAADVFRNKYGDCKDKATLLLTMLDHIGLRGYPALVGTRGDVEADPSVPDAGDVRSHDCGLAGFRGITAGRRAILLVRSAEPHSLDRSDLGDGSAWAASGHGPGRLCADFLSGPGRFAADSGKSGGTEWSRIPSHDSARAGRRRSGDRRGKVFRRLQCQAPFLLPEPFTR